MRLNMTNLNRKIEAKFNTYKMQLRSTNLHLIFRRCWFFIMAAFNANIFIKLDRRARLLVKYSKRTGMDISKLFSIAIRFTTLQVLAFALQQMF